MGIVASFVTPVIGYLSDKTNSKWGKRRPWIVIGVIINSCIGMFLTFSPSLAVFIVAMALDVFSMTGTSHFKFIFNNITIHDTLCVITDDFSYRSFKHTNFGSH